MQPGTKSAQLKPLHPYLELDINEHMWSSYNKIHSTLIYLHAGQANCFTSMFIAYNSAAREDISISAIVAVYIATEWSAC